jgi:prepilin peptidase CpaA
MSINLLFIALLLFTAAVAVVDFKTGHIPNPLVVSGLVTGLLTHVAVQVARSPLLLDALRSAGLNFAFGAFVCGIVPALLYRVNALGGGDVKLLIAIGAFTGPLIGIQVLFYSFLAAALWAPAKMAYHGRLLAVMRNSAVLLANPFLPKERRRAVPSEALTSMRFGPAVFAGACVVTYLSWSVS